MKSSPFLLLSAEGKTADLVKGVCSGLSKPVVLQIQREAEAALACLEQKLVVCVIADLGTAAHFPSTLFLQKFRKLKGYSAIHLVMLADSIDSRVMCLGAEFAAFRLVSGRERNSTLKDALESVLADLSKPVGLRAALLKLSQAQRAGNIGESDRILEDCYQLYRDETDVLLEYGAMCLRKGKLDKAEKVAETLSQSQSNDNGSLRVSNFLARVRLKQGNVGGALSVLDRAHLLSPDNLERLVLLGDVCRVRGQIDRAEQSYKRVLELESGNTSARKGMGLAALSQGDANRALDFFRGCFTEEEMGSFFNNTAVLAVRRKQYSKAEQLYNVADGAFVDASLRSRVAFNMGLMFRRWAKPDQAVRKFQEAMTLKPGYAKAAEQLRVLGAVGSAPLQDEGRGSMAAVKGTTERGVPSLARISALNSQGDLGLASDQTAQNHGAGRISEPVSDSEFRLFDFADDDLSGKGARVVETPLESEVAGSLGTDIRTLEAPVRDVKPFRVESMLAQTVPRPTDEAKANGAGVHARRLVGKRSSLSSAASSKPLQAGQARAQTAAAAHRAKAPVIRRASGGPAFIDDDDDDEP